MQKTKYCKAQAYFTIYFSSDFEPSILNKILQISDSKIVLKKDALITHTNPHADGFYQLKTNIGEDKNAEQAVKTILKPFIKNVEAVNKIVKDNNGYCCLDLFIQASSNRNFPTLDFSRNVIELISELNSTLSVNLV